MLITVPNSEDFKASIDSLYFEAHITIEPVFENRLEVATSIAEANGFRMAKLLMQKDRAATEVRSDKDTFMTSTTKDNYPLILSRVIGVIDALQKANFAVYRYKIESAIVDSRICDEYCLLPPKEKP